MKGRDGGEKGIRLPSDGVWADECGAVWGYFGPESMWYPLVHENERDPAGGQEGFFQVHPSALRRDLLESLKYLGKMYAKAAEVGRPWHPQGKKGAPGKGKLDN